jgi:hypothetical protein
MSSGIDESSEVARRDSTKERVVMMDQPQEPSDDASEHLPAFGEDLPEGEVRQHDPHLTRPLEPSDLRPALHMDSDRLSGQISNSLSSRDHSEAGEKTLLGQRSVSGDPPKAQIRLRPGTTRRKIAGAGVTAEPLVFQSETSEGLVEQWIDTTLGTNTQSKDRDGQPARPMPPAAALPPLPGTAASEAGVPPPYFVGTPGTVMPTPFPEPPNRLPSIRIIAAVALAVVAVLALASYKLFGTGGLLASANTRGVSAADQPGAVGNAAAYPDDVTVLTTATKAGWLDTEIAAFNAANQGKYHVTRLPLLESRDGMQAIINGKSQPVIFTPSSPVWIARLVQVWQAKHRGQQIADLDDPQAFRLLMRSPLVVLTTKDKAPFLRQVFHSTHPWARVRNLSLGKEHVPWGTFKFAHADPLDASSGMLTMSLILTEYAADTHSNLPLDQVAKSTGFHDFLSDLERGFVRDPTAAGSSALERAYTTDVTSRNFITAYESKAMGAVAKNPNLTVIYPDPTSVADQSAAVLNAPWVTPHERTAAIAFLNFLATDQSLRDAMKYDFRPGDPKVSLAAQINAYSANGFQDHYNSITLPNYDALNEAADQWRIIVQSQP